MPRKVKIKKYIKRIEASENVALNDASQRRRLNCYIYFLCQVKGRGKFRRRGKIMDIIEQSPVSGMRCLGYPARGRIWRAIAQVKREAPLETRAYEVAVRFQKEALNRLKLTRNFETWTDFFYAKRNWLRAGAKRGFRPNPYVLKYELSDMGSRKQEEARAHADLKEIWTEMARLRNLIFDKMQVPVELRFL